MSLEGSEWKVGDWAVHGTKVVQIQEVEDGRVTGVSDGYGTTGGHDLRCLPLTLENKRIAEDADYCWTKLVGNNHIRFNGPLIYSAIAQYAEAAMLAATDEERKSLLDQMSRFHNDINRVFEDIGRIEVNGIRVFGR